MEDFLTSALKRLRTGRAHKMTTPDLSYIATVFQTTSIGGMKWILNVIVTAICMVAITRDIGQWKTLFLPLSIGWWSVGLGNGGMIYIVWLVALIPFIHDVINVELGGNILIEKTSLKTGEWAARADPGIKRWYPKANRENYIQYKGLQTRKNITNLLKRGTRPSKAAVTEIVRLKKKP